MHILRQYVIVIEDEGGFTSKTIYSVGALFSWDPKKRKQFIADIENMNIKEAFYFN